MAGGRVQGPETRRKRGDLDMSPHGRSARGFLLTQLLSTPEFLLRPKLLCYLPLPPDLTTCRRPQSRLCVVWQLSWQLPQRRPSGGGGSHPHCRRTCVRRAGLRARTWGGGRVSWSPQSLRGLERKGQRRLRSGPSGLRGPVGVADWPPLPPVCWPGRLLSSLLAGFLCISQVS